jgi:hypothetical protein
MGTTTRSGTRLRSILTLDISAGSGKLLFMSKKKSTIVLAQAMSAEKLRQVQELRRSNAAGPVQGSQSTRRAVKAQAIKESKND